MVYFFLDAHIFGVDMRAARVVECDVHGVRGAAAQRASLLGLRSRLGAATASSPLKIHMMIRSADGITNFWLTPGCCCFQ